MATNLSYLMFCVVIATPDNMQVKLYGEKEWLSKCHVAVTEHGFANPKDRCFCVKMDDKDT